MAGLRCSGGDNHVRQKQMRIRDILQVALENRSIGTLGILTVTYTDSSASCATHSLKPETTEKDQVNTTRLWPERACKEGKNKQPNKRRGGGRKKRRRSRKRRRRKRKRWRKRRKRRRRRRRGEKQRVPFEIYSGSNAYKI